MILSKSVLVSKAEYVIKSVDADSWCDHAGSLNLLFSIRRANSRLAEANSKLLNERSRSLITNGSLGAPSLDFSSLASPANYGASLGPLNRNLGLGFSLLNPLAEGQNSRVEDYLAKVCINH